MEIAPGSLAADARAALVAWSPPSESQGLLRNELVAFIDSHDDAMWRACPHGHITASAIVVSHDRSRVLLTLHPKIGRWLQMGGHCEPVDVSLREASMREATEESGIADLTISDGPIDIDIHALQCPKEFANRHLDVRYLCIAPPNAVEAISSESLDLRWFTRSELPDDVDATTMRLIDLALRA